MKTPDLKKEDMGTMQLYDEWQKTKQELSFGHWCLEQGKAQALADVLKEIDMCIGYNQFNSIGEQARMIEVKELKNSLEKMKNE